LTLEAEHKNKIRAEQTTIKRRMLKKQKIAHCEYCGNKTKEILQIHHIEAISSGGNNDLDNLIILCPNCHKSAHAGIIKKEELHKLKKFPIKFKDFQIDKDKLKNRNIIEQLNSYIFRLEQKNEVNQKEIFRLQMENQKLKNSKIFSIKENKEKYNLFLNLFGFKLFIKV
jgi:hypothetical protein